MVATQGLRSTHEALAGTYRLIAELLLYPEERDARAIDAGRRALTGMPAAVQEPVAQFLASPRAHDAEEYLNLLELSPPCPLYLGTYLFAEPASCRGAGRSGRNGYMIELAAIYAHFGLEVGTGELPDFLPALTEFLALSLERGERDRIGLRERLLERNVRPGLAPMRAALERYDTPYALLLDALAAVMDAEREGVECLASILEGDVRTAGGSRSQEVSS